MSEAVSCPHCGGEVSVTPDLRGRVVGCPHCGKQLIIPLPVAQPLTPPSPLRFVPQWVPSHLVEAILVTIFCCQPFGIVAIVYAAQVDGKLASNDYAGARYVSERAKNWCLAAFLCGFLWLPIAFFVVLGHAHH